MNSANTHPNDQMSILVVQFLRPKKSSGARYHMVTTSVVENLPNFLANPKSATFTIPSELMRMLAGFKSLWATFWACKQAKPSSNCLHICCIRQGLNLYYLSRTKQPRSVSIKSKHRQMMGDRWLERCNLQNTTSLMFNMLGCSKCCRSLISRKVVMGKPKDFPSLSSFYSKFYIFFIATFLLSSSRYASYTDPQAPCPISLLKVYRSYKDLQAHYLRPTTRVYYLLIFISPSSFISSILWVNLNLQISGTKQQNNKEESQTSVDEPGSNLLVDFAACSFLLALVGEHLLNLVVVDLDTVELLGYGH